MQIGVRGVAVPIKNRHGAVVAALSVNMPIGKETREAALARVLRPLQEMALQMLNVTRHPARSVEHVWLGGDQIVPDRLEVQPADVVAANVLAAVTRILR